MKQLSLYTDGSCKPNPGPGGWAVVIVAGNDYAKQSGVPLGNIVSGHSLDTTNNRMELTAASVAVSLIPPGYRGIVHTDSRYVKRGITEWMSGWKQRGWRTSRKQAVANVELWKRLDGELQALAERGGEVVWNWVKGHAGVLDNERADVAATQARFFGEAIL